MRFLLSDASFNKLERWGFLRSKPVVVGDDKAVPASLLSLIRLFMTGSDCVHFNDGR